MSEAPLYSNRAAQLRGGRAEPLLGNASSSSSLGRRADDALTTADDALTTRWGVSPARLSHPSLAPEGRRTWGAGGMFPTALEYSAAAGTEQE
eukprot:CAMPEP_0180281714 /NCGR_PEP_ID=MMETSP0988-20121125/9371_1 /TAXON_ID=697907 /ORGANISM="non described non described, Strain CCMP2293" /LENGTH=92 /DNA_ID=CAMNT_0022253761 /DNA_START=59 /DNA_END=336 /DNA_ORIENTATION=+